MLEVEAAYNASLKEASEKLPASIDRLMCDRGPLCVAPCFISCAVAGRSSRSLLYCSLFGELHSCFLFLATELCKQRVLCSTGVGAQRRGNGRRRVPMHYDGGVSQEHL